MSNIGKIKVDDLHQYVQKIATKNLALNGSKNVIVTGVIEESLPGYYNVELTNSDTTSLIQAIPMNTADTFFVNDYVYLIKAEVKSGDTFKTKYFIFGLVSDTQEEFANLTEYERFQGIEESKQPFPNVYLFSNSIKSFDVTNIAFLEDIVEKGNVLLAGTFNLPKECGITEGNYGIRLDFYKTNPEEVFLTEELGVDLFTGQPYNLNNIFQKRIIQLNTSEKISKIKVTLFSDFTVKKEDEIKFYVKDIILQAGSLLDIGAKLSVKIDVTEGNKDYFRTALAEDVDTIGLTATAYFDSQPLDSAAIKYYWFIKDKNIAINNDGTYNSIAGEGWRCLNNSTSAIVVDKDNQPIQSNSIRVWDAKNNTINFNEQDKAVLFKQYENIIKCIIRYQGAQSESAEYTILNFSQHSFHATLETDDSTNLLVNENSVITLTCHVEDSNKKAPEGTISYKWFVNGSEIERLKAKSIRVKDNGIIVPVENENIYEIDNDILLEGDYINISCQATIDVGEAEGIIVSTEDEKIRTIVAIAATLKQLTYYKYYISNNMSVQFLKATVETDADGIKSHISLLPTLDTQIDGSKIYYLENGNIVDNPIQEELSSYWEQYEYNIDWSILDTDTNTSVHMDDWIRVLDSNITHSGGVYRSEEAYYYIETDNTLFNDIFDKINEVWNSLSDGKKEESNMNKNPYLYYSSQTIWYQEKLGIHEFMKVEDWTSPVLLRQVKEENGVAVDLRTGAAIEKINTFNQLTNNGADQGILYNEETGDLYINATYIQTGAINVAKDGTVVFSADIDSGDVVIAGFTVDQDSIDAIAHPIHLGTDGLNIGDKLTAVYNEKGDLQVSVVGSITIMDNGEEKDLTEVINTIRSRQLQVVYSSNKQKPTSSPTYGDIGEGKTWHTGLTDSDIWMCQKVDITLENTDIAWGDIVQIKGLSVESITEYYAISANSSIAPNKETQNTTGIEGWRPALVNPTKDYPFLWNYEVSYYDKEKNVSMLAFESEPVLIAYYTEDGRGIEKIENKYVVNNIGKYSEDWLSWNWIDTPGETSVDNKYLWNYEIVTYKESNGVLTTETTTPAIIGTHGETGVGVKKLNTYVRNFTLAQWQTYGAEGHIEKWNTYNPNDSSESYDNSHIQIGDTIYITGFVTDLSAGTSGNVTAALYGVVDSIDLKNTTMPGITATTSYLILGGEKGEQGDPGKNGDPGATGNGIETQVEYYKAFDSNTTIPDIASIVNGTETPSEDGWYTKVNFFKVDGPWDTQAEVTAAPYVWKIIYTTYTNGDKTVTDPVLLADLDAATNAAAAQGLSVGTWCQNMDRTIIDGSTIATGSVTAEQINTAGLQAEYILVKDSDEVLFEVDGRATADVENAAGARVYAKELSALSANMGTITAGLIRGANQVYQTQTYKDFAHYYSSSYSYYVGTATVGKTFSWSFNATAVSKTLSIKNALEDDLDISIDSFESSSSLSWGWAGADISSVTASVIIGTKKTGSSVTLNSSGAATLTENGDLTYSFTITGSGSYTPSASAFPGQNQIRVYISIPQAEFPISYWQVLGETLTSGGIINFNTDEAQFLSFPNLLINQQGILISGGDINLLSGYSRVSLGNKYNGLIIENTKYTPPNANYIKLILTGQTIEKKYFGAGGDGERLNRPYQKTLINFNGKTVSNIKYPVLSGRWYVEQLYDSSGQITSSDRNVKNSIQLQPDIYSLLFDKFQPSIFKYNDGTSDRYHMGLIAQDVEQAVLDIGLTTQDFAAICFDVNKITKEKEGYGIRYEELVSMCIYEIQQNKIKIKTLETKVAELENLLYNTNELKLE